MTTAEPTPVPKGQQPLFLSVAIALPILDVIAWLGSPLSSDMPDSGQPGTLVFVVWGSLLVGLLFCIFSLVRGENLRVLCLICLAAYLVAAAPAIWPAVHAH